MGRLRALYFATVGVTIAVITRERPALLELLLERLAALYGDRPDVHLAIVDNDANGSAAPAVERHRDAFTGGVRYALESQPGYSTARNHAVRLVDTEYLAFIDDDEVPDPGWLEALLAVRESFAADVVAGPVITELPADADQAIARSGVFQAHAGRQQRAGDRMAWCATNNTLVRRAVFDRIGGFDVRFDRSGGEDSHLFLRATLADFTIVWCPDAVVREYASPARLQPAWHIARARHVGRISAALDLELRPNARSIASRAAKLGYQGARGICLLIAGVALGDAAVALRGRCALALAFGMGEAALDALRGRAAGWRTR